MSDPADRIDAAGPGASDHEAPGAAAVVTPAADPDALVAADLPKEGSDHAARVAAELVVEVVRPGYRLGGRLLRPAAVAVRG